MGGLPATAAGHEVEEQIGGDLGAVHRGQPLRGHDLRAARKERARYQNLVWTGACTVQRQQQADVDLRRKRAANDKAVTSPDAARTQRGVADPEGQRP